MGRPKPLLDWGGETLIEYQVRQLIAAGIEDLVVVLGHRADEIAALVEDGTIVVHEGWAEGRASSLRRGAEALTGDVASVVVLGADQPRPAAITRRLIDEHAISGALITVPSHEGTRGHPPVLDGSLIPDLLSVRDETQGLREVIERRESEILEVAFDDPIVLLDLNTPEDYERARAQQVNQ